jgi:hypothetical protein
MPEPIRDPLWDLMLSTNDCYPGCGCEGDYFDITTARVSEWVKSAGEEKNRLALEQLQKIKRLAYKQLEEIRMQTNIYFSSTSDFENWINEWEQKIEKSCN